MYTHLGTCITRETVTWRMHIPRKSYRGRIAREAITSSECKYPGTQPHPAQHTPAQIYNYTRRVYTAKGTVLHRVQIPRGTVTWRTRIYPGISSRNMHRPRKTVTHREGYIQMHREESGQTVSLGTQLFIQMQEATGLQNS